MKNILVGSALALSLAACSSEPVTAPEQTGEAATTSVMPDEAASAAPNPAASPKADATVLSLEGLGDLRIGQAVPPASSWAERGAQISDACRTVSSPDYPGVYAIVEQGKVRRITLGQQSKVKLVEGVGVGSPESDVQKWFAGFREEPHKYEDAPAKYLTAPNVRSDKASDDPALRFEIGQDRKVKLIHVGTMPVLGYVEGCA